jgi:hypothetical protein
VGKAITRGTWHHTWDIVFCGREASASPHRHATRLACLHTFVVYKLGRFLPISRMITIRTGNRLETSRPDWRDCRHLLVFRQERRPERCRQCARGSGGSGSPRRTNAATLALCGLGRRHGRRHKPIPARLCLGPGLTQPKHPSDRQPRWMDRPRRSGCPTRSPLDRLGGGRDRRWSGGIMHHRVFGKRRPDRLDFWVEPLRKADVYRDVQPSGPTKPTSRLL